ncbi:hypothetical protein CBS101457_006776 [Exobasidium rhododendri]|nr:hypothetical protein CBS101457_006776 [Exobasidium rhododendri]
MSTSRTRSESDNNDGDGNSTDNRSPSDLLAPFSVNSTRHISASSSHRSLSIASYYYSNNNHQNYDFTADPAIQSESTSWPPVFESVTGSPRGRALDEIAGGSSLLHRRTSSSIQREQEVFSHDGANRGRAGFSGWASGLQLGAGRAEVNEETTLAPPPTSNPFDLREETPPQITLSHFSDPNFEGSTILQDNIFEGYTHRDEGNTTAEGDMGRYRYGQLERAGESLTSLNYGEGTQQAVTGSLPSTPIHGTVPLMDEARVDESEGAFLTLNQTQAGWNRLGETTELVDSPEENDERANNYFSKLQNEGDQSLHGNSPLRLEDGRADNEAQLRSMQRSSADAYAHLGGGIGKFRARAGLDRIGKSLRRISRRVVNTEGINHEGPSAGHIRLPDVDEDESSEIEEIIVTVVEKQPPITPFGLRGKSLGIFGPTNPIRKSLARLMDNAWVEPLILIMIMFNVVLLIIQAAPSVFSVPRKPGYFDYWIDYALMAVFGIFTVEIIARIVISGLVINPPALPAPPTVHSEHADPNQADTPSLGHQRRKASRSNTLDTFAVFGETIKSKASDVFRPQEAHQRMIPPSPNRASAPRTVLSDYLHQEPYRGHTESGSGGHQRQIAQSKIEKDNSVVSRLLKGSPFAKAVIAQRSQATHYAYLRHSWNRIDFIAVLSYWAVFFLAFFHQESTPHYHIYIFRALSVLRAARLLTITSGTSTILQSLKTAGPLLINVAFFTLFSMLLFSIIGIQAFKGSYRRSCVWIGDLNPQVEGSAGTNYTLSQICGGYFNAEGQMMGRVNAQGHSLSDDSKGYVCPYGQICVESATNPENNTSSFDNIFQSLLQVVIVISSNNWSQTMYDMIDADYFSSCLYFIFGIIIMNFWMANLFVAVITNTFATITAETKQSAFAAKRVATASPSTRRGTDATTGVRTRQRIANVYKRVWAYTKFFWLAVIVADLGVQASQASHKPDVDTARLVTTELYITIALDVEILMRFFSYLLDNDWRGFFAKRRNIFDLFLATITSIMQIPIIKASVAYSWLTVFQLARFYRVIVAVPRMEALLFRVFGSMAGLFNMILFLLLMVGLASLIAVQLFRGDIPQVDESGQEVEMNFKHIFNSFLSMYQVFTSENWTDVLYNALSNEGQYKQAVFAGIFICGWFLFANFIVLQMFIAVIAENFGVAESQKRAQQLEVYLRKMEKPEDSWAHKTIHQLSPYRWLRERNQAVLDGSKDEKAGLAQRAIDSLDEKNKKRRTIHSIVSPGMAQTGLNFVRKALRLDRPEEQVPLDTIRARQLRQSFSGANMLNGRSYSLYQTIDSAKGSEEAARLFARDRQLTRMRSGLGLAGHEPLPQSQIDADHENRYKDDPRIAQARLINTHPSYEKSLWIFSNRNQFRRICQSFVPPSFGERLFGRQTGKIRQRIYQALIFSAIAASVAVAGVATPAYRREWYGKYGLRRDSWFSLTEVSLGIFFIIEFFVKVIADGFAFAPNAYLLSPWNALDLFVLLTLVINVSTELAVIGGVSRFTRALKAMRALRLINLSVLLRRAFSALLTSGGRFFDASVLAILYIVPFAVWGQNLFSGLLYSCTDTSSAITGKANCLGEYSASPSEWNFLAPRAWQNPTVGSVYSFDDFRSSLLILFEIVSLEGWINVMTSAMSITGRDQQLQTDSRQVNALFFVIYNLIGAVFVLTLFVAVIIESFQEFSGAAYLTTTQRQWIDLKRLIARQRPSKRPKVQPQGLVRLWCYNRSVRKHGWWSRLMTVLHICTLIVLATQQYSDSAHIEHIRDIIYVIVTLVFVFDIFIRLMGLGWNAFRSDFWNLFDLVVVAGTLGTTIPLLRPNGPIDNANIQLQKVFLTAVAFKLVQSSNALNQLFKTAVASLPSIVSLFLLWLTMFLVWGIMLVEVFGLTQWGPNETYQKNFSSLLGALVFLSMMSTGEGWNQYMHDYTLSPPLCTSAVSYLDTDCGSPGWAYFLFIGWNVISMYIFLNMFTGTVVENFSYVFQLGGQPSLSREQVRNLKQAWAHYDPTRSGYLAKSHIVGFLSRLDGALDVKMHPRDASLQSLKQNTLVARASVPNHSNTPNMSSRFARLKSPLVKDTDADKGHFMWPPSPSSPSPYSKTDFIAEGINITRLNQQLSTLDYVEIRRRKHRFERIYNEALIIAEQPANVLKGGIPFSEMLILLAHYKLINDDEALSLEELMERRIMQEKVEDRIETERIRGILRLIWLKRRYIAICAEKRRLSPEWQHEQQRQSERDGATSAQQEQPQSHPTHTLNPSRVKPTLSLDMRGIGNSVSFQNTAEESSRQYVPSPVRTIRLLGANTTGHPDQPIISLTGTAEDEEEGVGGGGGGGAASSSHSPTLQEIERRASPLIEHIDASAWGALAKRLSSDGSPHTEHSDGRGGYGQQQASRSNTSLNESSHWL